MKSGTIPAAVCGLGYQRTRSTFSGIAEAQRQALPVIDRNPNILIAEAEEALVAELSAFFDEMGFHCLRASTLNETLLTVQERRIDVLVLDAKLIGEDCAFLSIVKGMDEDLPIILCADTNTPEFESKVRQHRIFFYHIKSFGTVDLQTAIINAIEKSSHH